jgi:hypothetical protein
MVMQATADRWGRVLLTPSFTPTGWTKTATGYDTVAFFPADRGAGVYMDTRPNTNYREVIGDTTGFTFTGTEIAIWSMFYLDYYGYTENDDMSMPANVIIDGQSYETDRIRGWRGVWPPEQLCWGKAGLTNTEHTLSLSGARVTGFQPRVTRYAYNNWRVPIGTEVTYTATDGVNEESVTIAAPISKDAHIEAQADQLLPLYDNFYAKSGLTSSNRGWVGYQLTIPAWIYWYNGDPRAKEACDTAYNLLNRTILPDTQHYAGRKALSIYATWKCTKDIKYLKWACAYGKAFRDDWNVVDNVLTYTSNLTTVSVYPNQTMTCITLMALLYNDPDVIGLTDGGVNYSDLYQSSAALTRIQAGFDSNKVAINATSGEIRYAMTPGEGLSPDEMYGGMAWPMFHYVANFLGNSSDITLVNKARDWLVKRNLAEPFMNWSEMYSYLIVREAMVYAYYLKNGYDANLDNYIRSGFFSSSYMATDWQPQGYVGSAQAINNIYGGGPTHAYLSWDILLTEPPLECLSDLPRAVHCNRLSGEYSPDNLPSITLRPIRFDMTHQIPTNIRYRWDGGSWQQYSTPFQLQAGLLEYQAYNDEVYEEIQSQTYTYYADVTSPTTACNRTAGEYPEGTLITLSAAPDESEPVTIYYKWGAGETWEVYSAPFEVQTGTLHWYGVDAVLNVEEAHSRTFSIAEAGSYQFFSMQLNGIGGTFLPFHIKIQ